MSYRRKKVVRALKKFGFYFLKEGSKHSVFANNEGKQAYIPRHTEINRITLEREIKRLGIDWKEFKKYL